MAHNVGDPEDIVAIKCIDKKALRGKEDSLENEIKVLRRLVVALVNLVLHCVSARVRSHCAPLVGRQQRPTAVRSHGAGHWVRWQPDSATTQSHAPRQFHGSAKPIALKYSSFLSAKISLADAHNSTSNQLH